MMALVGCPTNRKPQPEPKEVVTPNPGPPKAAPNKLIANPIVEKAIRKSLNKPTGELTEADLEKVTELKLQNARPADVKLTNVPKGLEKLTKLKTLFLSYNKLTEVKDLETHKQLRVLYLHENQLTEAPKGLEKLTQLTGLALHYNKLTDVTGLEKLTKLTHLHLENNQLTNVKGLEKLTQLTDLALEDNPDLTKAQIDELQKALPNCTIRSNPTK